jgi:hypothetical protein
MMLQPHRLIDLCILQHVVMLLACYDDTEGSYYCHIWFDSLYLQLKV